MGCFSGGLVDRVLRAFILLVWGYSTGNFLFTFFHICTGTVNGMGNGQRFSPFEADRSCVCNVKSAINETATH